MDVAVTELAVVPLCPELRADAARNRARVIEVARAQVAAGDLSLPMNTIAKLAEVGVGTVYRHFPTRRALLEAIASDAFQALIAEAHIAAVETDPAAGLERLLRHALRLLSGDRSFAAVLAAPSWECSATLQLATQLGGSIATVLDRARQAALICGDISPDDLRRLICGLEHAVRAGPDGETKVDLYLEVLLAGLRHAAPKRSRTAKLKAPK